MRKLLFIFCFLTLGAPLWVQAQDPQFSQFYAAPLYLNPAFTGATQQARAGINYRSQWPALDASFVTMSAYFDYYLDDYNSGVGMLITHDKEGLADLRSTNIGLLYSYQLYLTPNLTFRPGLQVSVYNRNVSFADLTFGNQFNPNTGNFDPTTPSGERFESGLSKTFIDLAAGGVLYTRRAWFGIGAHHLNAPNQSIVGEQSPLPRKFSFHGGYKIMLKPGTIGSGLYSKPQERSLTPTFQYKTQGSFDQLDLGLYLTAEPIIFGLWYRGLPFKPFEGFPNNESLVFLVGFTKKGENDVLNIGYSYDYTISQLGASSGGAHEFSMSYSWPMANPRKPPKNVRQIPCPDF